METFREFVLRKLNRKSLNNGVINLESTVELMEEFLALKDAKSKEGILSNETNFRIDLEALINRYSKENESCTPDFVLTEYIQDCLNAFNKGVNTRNNWYEGNNAGT